MARRSVLLVEDHPELRKLLRECLEGLDVDAVEAADGRAALNRLRAGPPSLVCLDVVLPESSGYEICEFIRRSPELKNVPVLMMSGRRLPNESADAEEAGANLFLEKPFTREAFRRSVSELLGGASVGGEGE